MSKFEVDITPFTEPDIKGERNIIEYETSLDKSRVIVTIKGPGSVFYDLPQIAGEIRLNDPVFKRFAMSFGITPQLLQMVIVSEYLRMAAHI